MRVKRAPRFSLKGDSILVRRNMATVPDLANTRPVALLVDYTFVPIDNGDALLDALNELFGALHG